MDVAPPGGRAHPAAPALEAPAAEGPSRAPAMTSRLLACRATSDDPHSFRLSATPSAARREEHGRRDHRGWRAVLDDLIARGLRRPQFLIVDGAPGLEKALAAIWDGVPTQRCTVHKHWNLLAHAPERLHEEISADYTDMIYAATAAEIEERRRAFLRKWRLRHRAVADSLEEAGGNLFAFARLPRASGRARAPPMPSNTCTRSSSAGSKPRPSCPRQNAPRCCSGRCSRRARSI